MKQNEFLPVEVIKSFLGIKKGTVLKFDSYSSKYISRSREEEIGDDTYYYSGNAIEIDPVVIKNNLGRFFKVAELPAKPEPVEELPKTPEVESTVSSSEQGFDAPAEPIEVHDKPVEEEEKPIEPPEEATKIKEIDFMFECGLCHYNNKIASVKYGIFLPASKNTSMKLKCENCGLETNIFYVEEDETTENSK